ncbi:MAG TPA: hypothetical protein VN851_05960 [Thermoanaerobaculia bacterium]|nr:hypothetical protein [Thermoanaerobaculia bacterium]
MSVGWAAAASWFGRHLVLPLTPFLVGALVRYLYAGEFNLEALSPAELSFSMAMMSLVISTKASQIPQPNVRGAITSLYRVGVVVFVVLFALSMFLETDISTTYKAAWDGIQSQLAAGKRVSSGDLSPHIALFCKIVDRLRYSTIIFSLLMIPLTIITILKYDMEEL